MTHDNPARLCMLHTRSVLDRFYPSSEKNGFASDKGQGRGMIEFEANLGYQESPCLKEKKKKKAHDF